MKKLSLFKSVGFSSICAAMLVGCGGGGSSAVKADTILM